METRCFSASIYEYTYGFNGNRGSTHAFVLKCKNGNIMKNYITVYSPNESLLEDAVQKYCKFREV